MLEFARFQPVNGCSVNCDCLITSDVWSIFQVIMLTFLFCFEIKASEAAQIFFANRFVNSGTSSDSFSIVVSSISPPISFSFYVANDHILNWSWQARNLPRDVGLKAAPCFT